MFYLSWQERKILFFLCIFLWICGIWRFSNNYAPTNNQNSPSTYNQNQITEKININLASNEQLQALSGIGEVMAGRIVTYRNENGPFRSSDDLMKVNGIGPKKIETLKELIDI